MCRFLALVDVSRREFKPMCPLDTNGFEPTPCSNANCSDLSRSPSAAQCSPDNVDFRADQAGGDAEV